MEVLPIQQLRYQIATAAVNTMLYQKYEVQSEHETAIDLSIKATSTTLITSSPTPIADSSLPETSFSKANSFHKNEISSPKEDTDGSSSDEDVTTSHIKSVLPELHKHFEVQCKVGEGTFASVYLASLRKNRDQKYAIKHVTPTCHPSKIKKEIQLLKDIGGADNVCGILTCVRNKGNVAFILPYIRHDKFQEYVLDMDVDETRLYVKNLLIALRRVHQFNVIHRDVKPGNFLYDRQSKRFLLVDFGLAQILKAKDQTPKLAEAIPAPEPKPSAHVDSRKRKGDIENAHSPPKKVQMLPVRPVLKPTVSCRNIISGNNAGQKIVGPMFQMLAPPQPMMKETSTSVKASFVRVKNSQVKMLNAPMPSTSGSAAERSSTPKPKCPCYNKGQLCEVCLSRQRKLAAPRAGTPGFRPPEVLLKSIHQTTAVDIWAAGVMFLSILSGSYPFFRSPDDMTALAEIVTLFGSKAISEIAMKLDRVFVCGQSCPPLDLQTLCVTLRTNRLSPKSEPSGKRQPLCKTCSPSFAPSQSHVPCFCPSNDRWDKLEFPAEAFDLLKKMLDPNPATRITAEQALQHPFLAD